MFPWQSIASGVTMALVGAALAAGGGRTSLADESAAAAETPTVHRDIVFAEPEGGPLRCDIYLPPGEADAARPGVVLIHGGAWTSGDKWMMAQYARRVARAGMVAMAINYRHAPAWKYPAQLDDAQAALRWLVEQGPRYEVDPERIGVLGYSAGGHLACMLAVLADEPVDSEAEAAAGEQARPRAVVAGGAPCDFRDLPPDNGVLEYFFGGTRRERPEAYRAASPAAHVSPGDAPTLFFHGTRDAVVPPATSRRVYQRHLELGVPSEFVEVENQGHVVTFLAPSAQKAAVQFLAEQLRAAAP